MERKYQDALVLLSELLSQKDRQKERTNEQIMIIFTISVSFVSKSLIMSKCMR